MFCCNRAASKQALGGEVSGLKSSSNLASKETSALNFGDVIIHPSSHTSHCVRNNLLNHPGYNVPEFRSTPTTHCGRSADNHLAKGHGGNTHSGSRACVTSIKHVCHMCVISIRRLAYA